MLFVVLTSSVGQIGSTNYQNDHIQQEAHKLDHHLPMQSISDASYKSQNFLKMVWERVLPCS